MKNTKSIIAIIMAVIIICASFAACKANEATVNKDNVSESDTISVNASVPEGQTSNIASETTTEKETESTTKAETDEENTKDTVKTTVKETTTKKKVVTTTKKQTATTKKNTSENTTKKKASTTKKQTTTKKVTTTKPKTTVKNVTPKEVQNQVNAYIKSKGIPVNAKSIGISMTPDNSGWSERIDNSKERRNNGRSLQMCKERVDREIAEGAEYLYCYYDSDWFYILYL
ncbi:MAG: hypothetical protein K2I14_01535 [Eubacterium sp.]|nr:hypothetical protein [Eubacterium sp.]